MPAWLKKLGLSWSQIKSLFESEGAKNKAYDSDVDGVLDEAAIPSLPRSKISDFFSSPFWNNIPDRPSTFPPDPHTHGIGDINVNANKDWGGYQISNVDIIVKNVASLPAAGNKGRILFNTADNKLYYDNGTEWVAFS